MAVSSSHSQGNKQPIYEVYTYCKDPESKTSPWHIFCTDVKETEARAKAHDLFKTRMFERIEIQQKAPGNANIAKRKLIKVYRRHSLSNPTLLQILSVCGVALFASFWLTYIFAL